MKLLTLKSLSDETELVVRCVGGDRQAFAELVERYQGLVCGIAYSTCGDLGLSEELAQDTFVTAWKNLRELKDPAKLRCWLIGIVRNLANNSFRKAQRIPTDRAEPLTMEVASPMDTPATQAIGNEEAALMWRALEAMPLLYREPMVLFYREGESIQTLAISLDLTEELVRKRLSRGREMLETHVSRWIETTLRRTRPSSNIVVGVLAVLSGFVEQASSATAAATMQATAGTKTMAAAGGIGSLVTLPFLGIAAVCAELRHSMSQNRPTSERAETKKTYRRLLLWLLFCSVLFGGLLIWARSMGLNQRTIFAWTVLTFVAVQALGIVGLTKMARHARRKRQLDDSAKKPSSDTKPRWEYRSSLKVLGLPLIHIRLGKPAQPSLVIAWIAVGDSAIGGLLALGEVAIAPLSVGGIAIGVVPLGACAIGVFALGSLAVGWQAFGGLALAWNAALGVVAVAQNFALGGVGTAHAFNDAVASCVIEAGPFFTLVKWGVRHLVWLNLLWTLPLLAKGCRGHLRAATH
jgi:RNA polymerase sigma factor (sigma-70 family)